ncbi:hypothetical protein [Sinorhizobium mexicanum]|uniref:Uncharacterized protein n=1 Tax=Sinorhizobium mexicanum TaxID=375549 RepID=A0A859R020_9HYPH|nr:hypothetical protein [Sinorhizobium mexicanum]MBP1884323.1 hypothetical protein [Sinorhizobium mexicanum]QLL65009.1 hypothetical protein FKV68_26940 [Sinorhizobium mexicanum]
MDERAVIEQHLAQAERHVTDAIRHLKKQRTILDELERDGHDTSLAGELLATFEALYESHLADRDRLIGERAGFVQQPAERGTIDHPDPPGRRDK